MIKTVQVYLNSGQIMSLSLDEAEASGLLLIWKVWVQERNHLKFLFYDKELQKFGVRIDLVEAIKLE